MRSFILIIVLANLLSDNVWCRPGIEWKTSSISGWPFIQTLQAQQQLLPPSSIILDPNTNLRANLYPITYNSIPTIYHHPQHQIHPIYISINNQIPVGTSGDGGAPKLMPIIPTIKQFNKIPKKKIPINRKAEPTTEPSVIDNLAPKPEKIVSQLQKQQQYSSEIKIFKAIQLKDFEFSIEKIYTIPVERISQTSNNKNTNNNNVNGFATATRNTASDKPIPLIPVETYFGGYPTKKKHNIVGASLILEPSSKAIAGNGGMAVSAPISIALLRRNSSTRVLYRPESVAIAGVGGIAHAQSDLILDYID